MQLTKIGEGPVQRARPALDRLGHYDVPGAGAGRNEVQHLSRRYGEIFWHVRGQVCR